MRVSRRSVLGGLGSAALAALGGMPGFAANPRMRLTTDFEPFRRYAAAAGVRAFVLADRDEFLLAEGAIAEPSRIASIRKSLLNALYGAAAAEGRIDLDATLRDLGVDDYQPLTETEKNATIQHLLQSRSGVYIPSSAETAAMKAARPARGSHPPGSFWYYNNWDFNVLGEIYQRATGEGLFTAVEHRLAKPLGWEDFDALRHMRWSYDEQHPRFPSYNMWMSARDLARFGQAFLRGGEWAGNRIVPRSWIQESTTHYSETGRTGWRSGYGYMWWLASGANGTDPAGLPVGAYTAAGNGGRYVTVFPDHDLVLAVQPDEKMGEPPVPLYADPEGYTKLLRLLFV